MALLFGDILLDDLSWGTSCADMQKRDITSVQGMRRDINKDAENTEVVILGVGATALAVARCLKAAGIRTAVVSFPIGL